MMRKPEEEDDQNEIRKMIHGHNIGEWFILRGPDGRDLGCGKIVEVDKNLGILRLQTPQRYDVTRDEGFVANETTYDSTIRLDHIVRYDECSEEEAWGRVPVIPAMAYKGRNVSVGQSNPHIGRIYQVHPQSLTLKPYLGQRHVDGGKELEIVDEPLIIASDLVVVPLTQGLEEIVKIINSKK